VPSGRRTAAHQRTDRASVLARQSGQGDSER
jgi:hypothetical protein